MGFKVGDKVRNTATGEVLTVDKIDEHAGLLCFLVPCHCANHDSFVQAEWHMGDCELYLDEPVVLCSERLPTYADTDDMGRIFVMDATEGWLSLILNKEEEEADYFAWRHTPSWMPRPALHESCASCLLHLQYDLLTMPPIHKRVCRKDGTENPTPHYTDSGKPCHEE